MAAGIYFIKNRSNSRIYIGSSKNISSRFAHHRFHFRRFIHTNIDLQQDWNSFGEDNFVFGVFEECHKNSLLDREDFWKSKYTFEDRYDNELVAGRPNLGRKFSQKSRKRMSESQKRYAQNVKVHHNANKSKSKQHKEKIANTLSKEFILLSPNGDIIVGKNIKQFARENNLHDGNLYKVISGERQSHKGWRRP